LKAFKSVKRIREASVEELIKVVGEAKTKAIKEYFK
jgi:excinuclease ABC subunit C